MNYLGTNLFLGDKLIDTAYLGIGEIDYSQVVAPQLGYIIRPDTNASSVTAAIPGTKFGTTFGQSTFRSDISGYINGGSSFADAAMTGSGQTTSTTTNFSGVYDTSMSRGASSNLGALPGTVSNVNFGTGNFTIECWFYQNSNSNAFMAFGYNAGWGFFNWSSAGYYRWVAQNASFGETLVDYATSAPNGTWVHIAFCRSGTTWYGALNGTIRANMTLSGATGTSAPTQMMGYSADGSMATTLFQDFRITKGVARYTGSVGTTYTVPQSIVTIG